MTTSVNEIAFKSMLYNARLKPIMNSIRTDMDEIINKTIHHMFAREVSAKRARKLRKRGVNLIFHKLTSKGKSRYLWLPFPELKS